MALVLTGVSVAQPLPRVTLQGRSALGGVVRVNRPYAMKVQVQVNDPSLNQAGTLRVEGGSGEMSSEAPIAMSVGEHTYLIPFAHMGYGAELSLGGSFPRSSVNATLNCSQAQGEDALMLVLSPRAQQFAYLGGYKSLLNGSSGEIRLNHPSLTADLPDLWWTYLGHDTVVVHDLPNLKLSDAVEKCLLDFVRSGGNLVLVSNLDPLELKDSAFWSKTPFRPRGVAGGSPPMLEGEAQGQVLMRLNGRPLLLSRSWGTGTIYQVTAPAVDAEVLGARRSSEMWGSILKKLPASHHLEETFYSGRNRLAHLPELPEPATTALAWYLGIYTLVVIPGIYLYLRRRDQVLKLIVVVPVTSSLITLGAYWFNSSGRGKELVQRELGVALASSGQTSLLLDQTAVLFSPASLKFDLKLSPWTFLRPDSQVTREIPPTLICKGNELEMAPERVSNWGISRWRGLGLRQLPGPLSFRLLTSKEPFQLEIENQTGLKFDEAVLVPDSMAGSEAFAVPLGKSRHSLKRSLSQLSLQRIDGDELGEMRSQGDLWRGSRACLWLSTEEFREGVLQPQGIEPKVYRRTVFVVRSEAP